MRWTIVVRCLLLVSLCGAPGAQAAPDADRIVKAVALPKGSSSTVIQGAVKGRQYVDYQLRAGAGQLLKVKLASANGSVSFNLLPPESRDVAMFIGDTADNRFEGLLPTDGTYVMRVFLNRAAGRRGETASFSLEVEVTGGPLKALSGKRDALVPGTRFHAIGTTACVPPYTPTRSCEAGVIRRGTDGTATVELRWDKTARLRILFVQGKPVAADVPQAFTFRRDERGFTVDFKDSGSFSIPEPLVFGG